jgi:hypothetical protein
MNLPFADSNLYPDRTQPSDRPYEVEAVMPDGCTARCPGDVLTRGCSYKTVFLQDGVPTRRCSYKTVFLQDAWSWHDLELRRVSLTSCQG